MAHHPLRALIFFVLLAAGCSPPASSTDAGATDAENEPDDIGAADTADADTLADTPPSAAPDTSGPATVTIDATRAFKLVDPFVGTGGKGFGYAALTPAAQVPNGMVRLGPDTSKGATSFRQHHFSGYHADDTDIRP